jgi:hypothetical protein
MGMQQGVWKVVPKLLVVMSLQLLVWLRVCPVPLPPLLLLLLLVVMVLVTLATLVPLVGSQLNDLMLNLVLQH